MLNDQRIEKALKGIETTPARAKIPPILDKNPIFAANFLTVQDSEEALELMLRAFNSLKEGKKELPVLEACITLSYTNFNWYVDFTKELIKLVAEEQENNFNPPYELCPEEIDGEYPTFCPPMRVNAKKKVVQVPFRYKCQDAINKHRIIYISKSYSLEDFREGYPAWYSFSDTIVFEKYNVRLNKRVRIVFRSGEFHYYICGASDNWQEIRDIPLELDYVVSTLLFRN